MHCSEVPNNKPRAQVRDIAFDHNHNDQSQYLHSRTSLWGLDTCTICGAEYPTNQPVHPRRLSGRPGYRLPRVRLQPPRLPRDPMPRVRNSHPPSISKRNRPATGVPLFHMRVRAGSNRPERLPRMRLGRCGPRRSEHRHSPPTIPMAAQARAAHRDNLHHAHHRMGALPTRALARSRTTPKAAHLTPAPARYPRSGPRCLRSPR